jgi:hypothetical protein
MTQNKKQVDHLKKGNDKEKKFFFKYKGEKKILKHEDINQKLLPKTLYCLPPKFPALDFFYFTDKKIIFIQTTTSDIKSHDQRSIKLFENSSTLHTSAKNFILKRIKKDFGKNALDNKIIYLDMEMKNYKEQIKNLSKSNVEMKKKVKKKIQNCPKYKNLFNFNLKKFIKSNLKQKKFIEMNVVEKKIEIYDVLLMKNKETFEDRSNNFEIEKFELEIEKKKLELKKLKLQKDFTVNYKQTPSKYKENYRGKPKSVVFTELMNLKKITLLSDIHLLYITDKFEGTNVEKTEEYLIEGIKLKIKSFPTKIFSIKYFEEIMK